LGTKLQFRSRKNTATIKHVGSKQHKCKLNDLRELTQLLRETGCYWYNKTTKKGERAREGKVGGTAKKEERKVMVAVDCHHVSVNMNTGA